MSKMHGPDKDTRVCVVNSNGSLRVTRDGGMTLSELYTIIYDRLDYACTDTGSELGFHGVDIEAVTQQAMVEVRKKLGLYVDTWEPLDNERNDDKEWPHTEVAYKPGVGIVTTPERPPVSASFAEAMAYEDKLDSAKAVKKWTDDQTEQERIRIAKAREDVRAFNAAIAEAEDAVTAREVEAERLWNERPQGPVSVRPAKYIRADMREFNNGIRAYYTFYGKLPWEDDNFRTVVGIYDPKKDGK